MKTETSFFFIVNPEAGRGQSLERWNKVSAWLDSRNIQYEYALTSASGEAINLSKEAILKGYRFLVAVGGDGTLSEVLNGVFLQDKVPSQQIALGKINTGTGNDWGKTYGLSPSFMNNAELLLNGRTRLQDVGLIRFNGQERYFINIAGAGYDSEVVFSVNQNKRKGGKLTYILHLLKCLLRYKSVEYTLVLDNCEIKGMLFSLAAGNCNYNGGGMKILPEAIPDDGLLDITVIEDISIPDIIRYLPKLYDGSFVSHPAVKLFKSKKIRFTSGKPLKIEADGENLGEGAFEMEVIPGAIQIIY